MSEVLACFARSGNGIAGFQYHEAPPAPGIKTSLAFAGREGGHRAGSYRADQRALAASIRARPSASTRSPSDVRITRQAALA
jgi:hypothetical protein